MKSRLGARTPRGSSSPRRRMCTSSADRREEKWSGASASGNGMRLFQQVKCHRAEKFNPLVEMNCPRSSTLPDRGSHARTMTIKFYRNLWGIPGPISAAVATARESGYDGIEAILLEPAKRAELRKALRHNALPFKGVIWTRTRDGRSRITCVHSASSSGNCWRRALAR